MDAALFLNLSAGDEDHASKALRVLLRETGVPAQFCSPKSDSFGERLDGASGLRIGGNGTAGGVAAQWQDHRLPLATLPPGRANNLARALGRRETPEAFAEGPCGRRRFVEDGWRRSASSANWPPRACRVRHPPPCPIP